MRGPWRLFVSATIAGILGLQLAVSGFSLPMAGHYRDGTVPTGVTRLVRPPTLWPFLNYPMYSTPHHEGEVIPVRMLLAEFPDGATRPVEELRVSSWHLQILFDELDPGTSLAADEVLGPADAASKPTALVLVEHPLVLRRDGAEAVSEERVIGRLSFR